MEAKSRPVFFNESGRRARVTNAALALICCLCGVGLIAVVYTLLVSSVLPRLPEIQPTRPSPSQNTSASSISSAQTINLAINRQVPKAAAQTLRFAHFKGGPGAFASLKLHASDLDALIPEWLEIIQSNGRTQVQVLRESSRVAHWLRSNARKVDVYPQINSGLSAPETLAALALPTSRSQIIGEILKYIDENGFQGVAVQLAGLPVSGQAIIREFLRELRGALRARQSKLITIASVTDNIPYVQLLSQQSDYVLLITHDNAAKEKAGPIAAQAWYEVQLAAHLVKNDPGKFIVSIGTGGYNWDEFGGRQQISTPAAWTLMEKAGAILQFDSRALNPTFDYSDSSEHRHQVWFLDAATAFNQLRATLPYRPAGIALGHLGFEDPGVWSFWPRPKIPDEAAVASLQTMHFGHDFYSDLKAALVSASPGTLGKRDIIYNKTLGLIVGQSITLVPAQANVTTLLPVDPKMVALTFDDGPDPTYTGKILDILADKKVKATFYVVGRNAYQFSDILKRTYDEGHDIGNHTFSHPRLIEDSGKWISLEVNATQRIFESQLGLQTVLFRSPGAFGDLSYLDEAPEIIEIISRLGYQIGHFDVESNDWASSSKVGVVDRVVGLVAEGAGQIVLMHDAGGNRQITVEALPEIIDQLQAKGFHFVTTHELVGKSRDEIMPPHVAQSLVEAAAIKVSGVSVQTLAWLGNALPIVAIATSILAIFRLTLIIMGATWHKARRSPRALADTGPSPRITVLVPAYNEERVIAKTIQTLLDSTVSAQMEIIVIDDGSSDRTAEVVRTQFGSKHNVRVCIKPNGGKAAALNHGIQQTDATIIVAIDADTVILPNAVEHLVQHFADPSVGAVAGSVYVGNRVNLITRFQALEYTMSQSLDRRAFELFNAIGVVPGAIGAWRRQALIEAGGYSADTLAEDADLTLSLERRGWKVMCEPKALALTEAPESLREFLKQRFRWMFGTLQVAYKHSNAVLSRPNGVSLITIPNIFLFQFVFTLMAPIMDLILIWTGVTEVLSLVLVGSEEYRSQTLLMLAGYWIIFQLFDLLAGAAAILLNGNSSEWKLIPLLFIQRFCYRQLLYLVAVRALLTAIRGSIVGWGRLVRTGNVHAPEQLVRIPQEVCHLEVGHACRIQN